MFSHVGLVSFVQLRRVTSGFFCSVIWPWILTSPGFGLCVWGFLFVCFYPFSDQFKFILILFSFWPQEAIMNSMTEGKEVLLPASPYLHYQLKTNHIHWGPPGLDMTRYPHLGQGTGSKGAAMTPACGHSLWGPDPGLSLLGRSPSALPAPGICWGLRAMSECPPRADSLVMLTKHMKILGRVSHWSFSSQFLPHFTGPLLFWLFHVLPCFALWNSTLFPSISKLVYTEDWGMGNRGFSEDGRGDVYGLAAQTVWSGAEASLFLKCPLAAPASGSFSQARLFTISRAPSFPSGSLLFPLLFFPPGGEDLVQHAD